LEATIYDHRWQQISIIPINGLNTYTIVLRWSEPEQVYRAEVPALPGCEGSGHSDAEALASVRETIRWWQERSGEGSSSPVSQMLMEEEPGASEGE
jgi:predicted RNase H-like HicB family nuclease